MFQKSRYTEKRGKQDRSANYDWGYTKNFFIWTHHIWGQQYLVDVNKDDQVTYKKFDGRKAYDKFTELWHEWSSGIKREDNNWCFEYPVWDSVKHYKDVITIEILAGVPLVFVFVLCAFSTELRTINVAPILFIIPGLILTACLVSLYHLRKRTKFHKICVINNRLRVNFIDGSIKDLGFENIKRYAFDINAYSSFIVFGDNTKLAHLERVSYWPILREYLLSNLEASEGT
jgi:hypothetical protein